MNRGRPRRGDRRRRWRGRRDVDAGDNYALRTVGSAWAEVSRIRSAACAFKGTGLSFDIGAHGRVRHARAAHCVRRCSTATAHFGTVATAGTDIRPFDCAGLRAILAARARSARIVVRTTRIRTAVHACVRQVAVCAAPIAPSAGIDLSLLADIRGACIGPVRRGGEHWQGLRFACANFAPRFGCAARAAELLVQ
jgi:hypothetical protein